MNAVAISGCRLADGLLHWGHLNGCFTQIENKGSPRVIFIIQDEYFHSSQTLLHKRKELTLILRQIYSIDNGRSIVIPVLQSDLFPVYANVYNAVGEVVTLPLLEDTNPKKANLSSRIGIAVNDYTFPIHQVSQILGAGASYVYMNDDNLRFVFLARRVRKKLQARYKLNIVRPELVTGPSVRIIGFDGRKMSKANNNTVNICDAPDVTISKISSYNKAKFLQRRSADIRWAYQRGEDILIPPDWPLFTLRKAAAFLLEENINSSNNEKIGDLYSIIRKTSSSIDRYNKKIRDNFYINCEEDVIYNRFMADTQNAIDTFESNNRILFY